MSKRAFEKMAAGMADAIAYMEGDETRGRVAEPRKPGRPAGTLTSEKVATSIRIDRDTLEHFKAGGPGWQTRINDALRRAAGL
jgi:uncharacterized protein (DUF4415 family)